MLLQLSTSQPVDHPESTVIIRACTYGSNSTAFSVASQPHMENPKKSSRLYQGGSLKTAAACATDGNPSTIQLLMNENGDKTDGSRSIRLLEGLGKFFEVDDNCDENFLFAYYRQSVADVFIGTGLGKPTAKSAIGAISKTIRSSGSSSKKMTIELCGDNRKPEQVFGISFNSQGKIAEVQKQLMQWSQGNCALDTESKVTKRIPGVEMFDIIGMREFEDTENVPLTPISNPTQTPHSISARLVGNMLSKRATCKHIQVESGDSCVAHAARCNIRGNDFLKYNPQKNLCANLKENNYVCCSSGDAYKPEPPKPSADGTCATHLIKDGDTCDSLAKKAGVTVADLEKFNKGKTWAWTDCKDLLIGYNLCLGPGNAPMPPPQEGAECGPLVPGTKAPTNKSVSIADLNPCPLKACCSNWGFCGVFPGHCTDNSPKGGGPGSKKKGFQTTCVSNCGNKIKQNSGPSSSFQRIGYYEAYGMSRDCLWLKAKDANTDGSYTHIHWAFASIDPTTWKPVIKEGKSEWADFKKLKAKRIVSLGGWADSTEPDKYNIIRSAIINNRETFAANLAKFADEEGIDGIDIDWEYPGAPDIEVGGKPIGQKRDGLDYLRFLTVLRSKMSSDKLVSIAAPASYWYLKAFPIDKIAEVVDYIVYMTYDLHGQWDYGNPNAYDQCDSGKCIRSHGKSLDMPSSEFCRANLFTKAGVPHNKVFVGEASYGRSFHVAQDGCWKPNCEFTDSRTESDAAPGRCTKTGGYLAFAEIMELHRKGVSGMRVFHDTDSDSDIMLYKGDYISYMTPKTKDSRRSKWEGLNFAGSIDWAVDLQKFTAADFDAPVKRPDSGDGCIQGQDDTDNTGSLCEYTCNYGFCPESLCTCTATGPLKKLPSEDRSKKAVSFDEEDADLNRLCRFACKYSFCPEEICTTEMKPQNEAGEGEDDDEDDGLSWDEQPNAFNYSDAKWQNVHKCYIYKDTTKGEDSLVPCKNICRPLLDETEEEGRTSNYGCVGLFPLDEEIPWQRAPGTSDLVAPGQCNCDNFLVNYFADTIIEALPIIAQIGCYILMSSLKFVIDAGTAFLPGPGRALDAGLDMAATAAQIIAYIYPEDEKPEEAFEWWFSVCGGTDLVPDEINQIFDLLSTIPSGRTSFKPPKKIKKGSGKKGDEGNPRAPAKPRPKPPKKNKSGGGVSKNKRCNLRHQEQSYVVDYHMPARGRDNDASRRCQATATRRSEHDKTWTQNTDRKHKDQCDMDEYPPAYLLTKADPAWQFSGKDKRGQRLRFIPRGENAGAAAMWKSICLKEPLKKLTDAELWTRIKRGTNKQSTHPTSQKEVMMLDITIGERPEFSMTYDHEKNPKPDSGLASNPCLPAKLAVNDPGFALLSLDEWYDKNPQGANGGRTKWNYAKPYKKGSNGD
ncbi:glycoside hydrolase family 18 [Fusarium phyllophilum]|uniref:chitinase n=1 Tax=Fusarium phyllophilum TaxID=47803 RepID=A0A8H5ISL7_9HYPO|nr:glycoside hydrolase family 18 [Fusarium phyllophilum]